MYDSGSCQIYYSFPPLHISLIGSTNSNAPEFDLSNYTSPAKFLHPIDYHRQ